MSADSSRYASEWFGAILTYLFFKKSRAFEEIYDQKHQRRNITIGWLLQITLLGLLILAVILLYKSGFNLY